MQEYEHNSMLPDAMHLPCPSCGSQLLYTAENQKLSCAHCGYLEAIDPSNDLVLEQPLFDAIEQDQDFSAEVPDQQHFQCENCSAKFVIDSRDIKVNCGFCGSSKVNLKAYEHQYIQPVGIIPFYVARDKAEEHFKVWIKQGWFTPFNFQQFAKVNSLHGVYIPFWTYDAQTHATWQGEAGHYYYETIQVRVNGQMQTQQVQKTRWTHRSGALNHFFDDVLVVASGGLVQEDISRILPYRLTEVVNFDPRLMVGWEAEIYQKGVKDAYQVGEKIMDHRLRNMCSAQLGGDTQRNLHVNSRKSDQTFKHIILPLWVCSYNYKNRVYRFTINGQTGRVYGQKPTSWIKIVLVVLLVIAFLAGIWYLRETGVIANFVQ